MKLGILSTHPIQYYSPLYRELAARREVDLTVYYAYRPTPEEQGVDFGVRFEWDVPLLDGYRSVFLQNVSGQPSASTYRGCDTPEIAGIIESGQFDAFLVHGWHVKSYWQAMRACWQSRTPLMVRGDSTLLMRRNPVIGWAKWMSRRRFVPRFDAYLIVGQRAREYYLAHGARADRMYASPHHVDNERFLTTANEFRAQRDALRRRWNVSKDGVVFLFVGKLVARKRPLDFVRAVAAIRDVAPRAQGLIVGDGELRAQVEQTIGELHAPITVVGFLNQTEIVAAYAASDVLVLPSEGTETWGLVVNEAMACGLTAIVSDEVGCGPDLVTPDETGSVYPCGDVAALVVSMTELANDAHSVARLKVGATERIKAYSVNAAADGVVKAIEKLAASPKKSLSP
jgi:glycosyltransferase involved in cell wall biosynthesis